VEEQDLIAEQMRQLTMFEGWKRVEKHMTDRISYLKDQLEHCKIEEVEGHRKQIQALKGVLNHVTELQNPVVEHP
jgi:hypothetical protein